MRPSRTPTPEQQAQAQAALTAALHALDLPPPWRGELAHGQATQLGRALGVSRVSITQWWTGQRVMPAARVEQAQGFGVAA